MSDTMTSSEKKEFSPYFDPDQLVLTKDMIRNIINAIIRRWRSGDKPPFWAIKALEAFRISLRFYSDAEINTIFKSIITCVNEMQMLNAMARMKNEMPTTKELADMVVHKMNSGEMFKQ